MICCSATGFTRQSSSGFAECLPRLGPGERTSCDTLVTPRRRPTPHVQITVPGGRFSGIQVKRATGGEGHLTLRATLVPPASTVRALSCEVRIRACVCSVPVRMTPCQAGPSTMPTRSSGRCAPSGHEGGGGASPPDGDPSRPTRQQAHRRQAQLRWDRNRRSCGPPYHHGREVGPTPHRHGVRNPAPRRRGPHRVQLGRREEPGVVPQSQGQPRGHGTYRGRYLACHRPARHTQRARRDRAKGLDSTPPGRSTKHGRANAR